MGWYALYKWFKPWRKTPYVNHIEQHNEFLYNKWYESLSDEEKLKEDKRKEEEKEKTKEIFHMLYSTACYLCKRGYGYWF